VTPATVQGESPSEKKLLERCLNQDKKAWDNFVDQYGSLISHAIVQTLKSYSFPQPNQLIPDLFHTVFLAMIENDYKKLRQFQWKCSLSSWIHLIAVTVTVDYLRKHSKHLSTNGGTDPDESLDGEIPDGGPLPDRIMELKEEKRLFRQIKEELNAKERLFVDLCYNRELPPARISKVLKITENNVYQLKNRIREKMKRIAASLL
jgi:RNA polymerase sigma factor (sigma-70 family)